VKFREKVVAKNRGGGDSDGLTRKGTQEFVANMHKRFTPEKAADSRILTVGGQGRGWKAELE